MISMREVLVGLVSLLAVACLTVSLRYNWTPEVLVLVAPFVCGIFGYDMGKRDGAGKAQKIEVEKAEASVQNNG